MPAWNRTFALPGVTADRSYARARSDIAGLLERAKLGHFDLQEDPAAKKIRFDSKLASATLHCRDGEVEIDAKLSLVAFPFRGQIEKVLENWAAEWKRA